MRAALAPLFPVISQDQREALVAVELISQQRHVKPSTVPTRLRRGGREPASAASDVAMAAPSAALCAAAWREDRQEPRDEGQRSSSLGRRGAVRVDRGARGRRRPFPRCGSWCLYDSTAAARARVVEHS